MRHPASILFTKRLRAGLGRAVMAAGLGLAAAMVQAASRDATPTQERLTLAVLADRPGSDRDELLTSQMLSQIGREADLAIHAGGIKSGAERCDDDLFLRRRQLLDESAVPLVTVPGEHDWTSCDQPAAGHYGTIERLARLREIFHESRTSLGQAEIDLQRQSDTGRYRSYPENARWEQGNVLFVTLNTPANANNYQLGAGRNGEYEERVLANASWLRQAFSVASRDRKRAIVLVFDADPDFEGRMSWGESDGRDPYADLKTTLARQATKFSGQVVVIHGAHGDGRQWTAPDHPLRAAGKTVENVTRIRTLPASNGPAWLKIWIEPGRKGVVRAQKRHLGQPGGPPQ